MLFDLRATGRRRLVKIVYVFLALLIGGGLVFFGVGGSGFGLLNADQNSGSGGSGISYEDQALKLEQKNLRPAPGKAPTEAQQASNWAGALKARFQAAGAGFDTQTGAYTDPAIKQLKIASEDWQQYLKVVKGDPDIVLAKLMAQAYAQGALNEPANAVRAWQIVAVAEPTGPTYSSLAIAAILASDEKIARKAEKAALEATPSDQRSTLKAQFKAARAQAKAQQQAQAAQAAKQSSGGVGGLP